jgi:hypothetical protein
VRARRHAGTHAHIHARTHTRTHAHMHARTHTSPARLGGLFTAPLSICPAPEVALHSRPHRHRTPQHPAVSRLPNTQLFHDSVRTPKRRCLKWLASEEGSAGVPGSASQPKCCLARSRSAGSEMNMADVLLPAAGEAASRCTFISSSRG